MNEDILSIWWDEVKSSTRIFKTSDSEFIVLKGFKITKAEGVYSLVDVRFTNNYSQVSDKDLSELTVLGFIRGVDAIGYERDVKRVVSYKKRTELIYQKGQKYKKELPLNKALNLKRIRNINLKIEEYADLVYFYKARVKQYKLKYKQVN